MLPTPAIGRWLSSCVFTARRLVRSERQKSSGSRSGSSASGPCTASVPAYRPPTATASRPKRRTSRDSRAPPPPATPPVARPASRPTPPPPSPPPQPAPLAAVRVREGPPRPHVGVALVAGRAYPQRPGHAQVDDQLAVAVQADQQVLAAAQDALDRRGADVERGRELRVRKGPRRPQPAADHQRLELAADRLDLGKLGHRSAARPACGPGRADAGHRLRPPSRPARSSAAAWSNR